jgi:(1->4)-alpha-D-glucan 1-alpha-D-glucosylmutase
MAAPTVPTSTFRLQITGSFDLTAAARLCDYLRALGAGAVYLSPLLRSAPGSEHGYDVVDFAHIDEQRGGAAGWQAVVEAARSTDLALVVDIVPNHAGVADAADNPAWWDVLRLGQHSPYASWFDIDWSCGRLLLPVLGDDFDADRDLALTGTELHYDEHRFPLAPGTQARPGETAAQVHDRQHYELVRYRRADAELNYRRFFTVSTLAGLRVEDAAVFEATHREVLRWVRGDGVAGLRVDHPDGLADPLGYLSRLHAAAPGTWLVVEKILEPGEALPRDWPVAGTTGYDALAEVTGLLVDRSAEPAFTAMYRSLTGDHRGFGEHVEAAKRQVLTTTMQAEVRRLARLCPQVERADEAITELLVAFPVYRSYLPDGADHLAEAVAVAGHRRPDLIGATTALVARLGDPGDELCVRFQQTTGAAMAKGAEDTAFYRYSRFVAFNEVGCDPSRFGVAVDDFHDAQHRRQADAPQGMTTLSTHDTKRGEDVRARLAVLAEVPDEWAALVRTLLRDAPVPNARFGYLLWQTLAGTGLIERGRIHAYAEKAMREAAEDTAWVDPDYGFESAAHAAVDAVYDSPELRAALSAFVEQITPFGRANSLTQKLVQLTMPGVPDVYQGSELWVDSLVDPDNRRPVDFPARRDLLAALTDAPPVDATGAAKLWVVSRALHLRRERPDLFTSYTPVYAQGPAAGHAVAFDRGGAVTVATRLPVQLAREGGWRDTSVRMPGRHVDVLTGRAHEHEARLDDVLHGLPVALLVRES